MRMLRDLLHIAPHAGAHRAAIRCALSVAVPLAVLLLLDRVDLFGAAAFGAFTAIFARDLPVPARTKVQAATGAGLVLSVAVGLATAHLPGRPWTTVAVLVVLAGAASVLSVVVRWRPPGALFFVFAAGAFATIPAQSPAQAAQTLAVTAASALGSVVIGSLGALRRTAVRGSRPLRVAPWRGAFAAGAAGDVMAAAAIAGVLAAVLGVGHVYWAVLAAIVPATVGHRGAWLPRGLQRALGTVVGVLVAIPLVAAHLPAWAVALAAVVLQLAAELVVMRNYGLAMVFVTPLALVISSLGSTETPEALVADRLVATLIGVAVAFVVLGVRARWAATRSA